MNRPAHWIVAAAVGVAVCCMLSFYQTTSAAPPAAGGPFANPTELRLETVEQLKEIKELLKEQNALLRSGDLKVTIVAVQKAEPPQAEPNDR